MSERYGSEEATYKRARAKILKTQEVCGICGRPVDKTLLYPHPLAPTVDHIIPLSKGGKNTADNLQLAHWTCNRQKSDKLASDERRANKPDKTTLSNRVLPHSMEWGKYSEK